MAIALVLRADITKYSAELAVTLRGLHGDIEAVNAAKSLIDAGAYAMVKMVAIIDSAEKIFDNLNMSDNGDYMTVGDVIVWDTGKRELCLKQGWATI